MESQIVATPFGPLVARWTASGLYSCEFSADALSPSLASTSWSPVQQRFHSNMEQYFRDGHLVWNLQDNDWSGVSDFHRQALELCFKIPCGQTWTYGQLARQLERPQAARAVGGAMAKNRWPILIPCHRVVGSTGKLTGYSGIGGTTTKRQLLEMEQAWSGQLLVAN